MIQAFITIRIIDIIDILLVAFLMYQIYMLIRDTLAIHIFVAIIAILLLWKIVELTQMKLLGSILGQIIGAGVIAIIVLFQPEIRRFLIYMGTKYFGNTRITLEGLFMSDIHVGGTININAIVKACINMAKNKTGALIVLKRRSPLNVYEESGDIIDGLTSNRLLETIFSKNSPLHDGAVIIINERIRAARCVLPVSDNFSLPPNYGMRHRAGIGLTEQTDALVIMISEETGEISLAESGHITVVDSKILYSALEKEFGERKKPGHDTDPGKSSDN